MQNTLEKAWIIEVTTCYPNEISPETHLCGMVVKRLWIRLHFELLNSFFAPAHFSLWIYTFHITSFCFCWNSVPIQYKNLRFPQRWLLHAFSAEIICALLWNFESSNYSDGFLSANEMNPVKPGSLNQIHRMFMAKGRSSLHTVTLCLSVQCVHHGMPHSHRAIQPKQCNFKQNEIQSGIQFLLCFFPLFFCTEFFHILYILNRVSPPVQ